VVRCDPSPENNSSYEKTLRLVSKDRVKGRAIAPTNCWRKPWHWEKAEAQST
jgi:hypothetical protein